MLRRLSTLAAAVLPRWCTGMRPLPVFPDPHPLGLKYNLAVGVLPVGLMLAGLVPTWFLAEWLGTALGIPRHAPSRDHVRGVLFMAGLLSGMTVFMVGGYLLGFALDAVLLRYLFGWPAARVRELLLYSRPPPHWLVSPAEAERVGRRVRRYVCYGGAALSWSVSVVLVVVNGPMLAQGSGVGPLLWVVFLAAGSVAMGIHQWRDAVRLRDPPPPGLCPACGYDLRATPEPGGALLDRCPECGVEHGEK